MSEPANLEAYTELKAYIAARLRAGLEHHLWSDFDLKDCPAYMGTGPCDHECHREVS